MHGFGRISVFICENDTSQQKTPQIMEHPSCKAGRSVLIYVASYMWRDCMANVFGYYIKKISNHLEAGWNAALKSMDVTGTQLRTLEYLYHCTEDANAVSHISAHFGVKHTSVLHVLRVLEKKGYVIREPAEKGRRSKPIRLTQSGIALVKRNESKVEIVNQIMFAGMTAQEQEEFLRILKLVSDNLENHNLKEI